MRRRRRCSIAGGGSYPTTIPGGDADEAKGKRGWR
jgi:hypothetical protein